MTTLGEYWRAEWVGRQMARDDWDGDLSANGHCEDWVELVVTDEPGYWEGRVSELSMLAAGEYGEADR